MCFPVLGNRLMEALLDFNMKLPLHIKSSLKEIVSVFGWNQAVLHVLNLNHIKHI